MKSQELNLLYIFDAVMREGSVSRAADRLGLTQPAVSNAVARMRDAWRDPVVVRKGRQVEPTAFALELWEQIRDPINLLAGALQSREFQPERSIRSFRIALTDLSVDLYWLHLMLEVARVAPSVDLFAVPLTQPGAVGQLREASIDLALGPPGERDRSLRSRFLFSRHFRLAMRKDHPLAGKPISLEDFVSARHVVVSRTGNTEGHVDRALQGVGLKRHIALTVNHFSVLPKLLAHSDLIAVVPENAAEDPRYTSDLWTTEVPIALEPVPISLFWHARLDQDPACIWLRDLVERVLKNPA